MIRLKANFLKILSPVLLVALTACSKVEQMAESLSLAELAIASSSLSPAIQNQSYSDNVVASGGAFPYTFAIIAGSLPAGITMTSAGDFSGTATTLGTYPITIEVTDSSGATASHSFNFKVSSVINIVTTSIPAATVGLAYATTISVTGGSGVYTFDQTGLPLGFSISSSLGIISGASGSASSNTIVVTVTDSDGLQATESYTFNVTTPPVITTTTLPVAAAGAVYSQTLSVTGGTSPYTFSLSSGTLPDGLSLSTGGVISGTPTFGDNVLNSPFNSILVQVTDSIGQTDTQIYSMEVYLRSQIVGDLEHQLRPGYVGRAYLDRLKFIGGVGNLTFSIDSGSLPTGLSLGASNGFITGTPTAAGTSTVVFKITDSKGIESATVSKTIRVRAVGYTTRDITGGVHTNIGQYNSQWSIVDDFAVGDLNNDGLNDVAVAARDTEGVVVSLNNGNGSFTKVWHAVAGGVGGLTARPKFVEIGDIDSDGHQDIVATTYEGKVEIIYGDSNWQVTVPQTRRRTITVTGAGANLLGLTLANLNSDAGNLDIVISDWDNSRITILYNCLASANVMLNSVSTPCNLPLAGYNFHQVNIGLAGRPRDVVVHDFNNDGDLDIVSTIYNTNQIGIIRANNALGSFAAAASLANGANGPRGIVKADFNQDGFMDVATTGDNAVSVLINNTASTFSFSASTSSFADLSLQSEFIDAGDIDGDTYPDIVITAGNSVYNNTVTFYNPSGTGVLANRRVQTEGYSVIGVRLAPMYSTSTRPDLVLANQRWNGVNNLSRFQVYKNNNNTTASSRVFDIAGIYVNAEPSSYLRSVGQPVAGDVNEDGYIDVMVKIGGVANILLGQSDGSFSLSSQSVPTGEFSDNWWFGRQNLLTDVNGDTHLDFVTSNWQGGSAGTAVVVLGNGDGTFSNQTSIIVNQTGCVSTMGARSIDVADFNRDGVPDIVAATGCATSPGGQAFVFLGNGDGTFNPSAFATLDATSSNYVDSVIAHDYNFDGIQDVAMVANNGWIYLYLGTGSGFTHVQATQRRNLTMQSNISSFEVADLNNDGFLDFVATSLTTGASPTIGIAPGSSGGTLGTPTTMTGRVDADYSSLAHAGMFLADMDSDGYMDIVTLRNSNSGTNSNGGGGIHYYKGLGNLTFTNPTAVFSPPIFLGYSEGLLLGLDLNADGKTDMIQNNSWNTTYGGVGVNYNMCQ